MNIFTKLFRLLFPKREEKPVTLWLKVNGEWKEAKFATPEQLEQSTFAPGRMEELTKEYFGNE